jgi:hypothetical protein
VRLTVGREAVPLSNRHVSGSLCHRKENHVAEDKTLKCVDCQSEFTFTAGEQEFYASKGFTNEPKRCPACRQAKKQQRNSDYSYDMDRRAAY